MHNSGLLVSNVSLGIFISILLRASGRYGLGLAAGERVHMGSFWKLHALCDAGTPAGSHTQEGAARGVERSVVATDILNNLTFEFVFVSEV